MLTQRVNEAARLGYQTVFVPAGSNLPKHIEGARLWPVTSLSQVIRAALG